jgi:hypothetical protein
MGSGDSAVVERLARDPSFVGLNPPAVGTGWGGSWLGVGGWPGVGVGGK